MKSVRFEKTTKGIVGYVKLDGGQEKIAWFIRLAKELLSKEKGKVLFEVHKSEDGGKGFRLIPRDTNEYLFPSVNSAKAFIYKKEIAV